MHAFFGFSSFGVQRAWGEWPQFGGGCLWGDSRRARVRYRDSSGALPGTKCVDQIRARDPQRWGPGGCAGRNEEKLFFIPPRGVRMMVRRICSVCVLLYRS